METEDDHNQNLINKKFELSIIDKYKNTMKSQEI